MSKAFVTETFDENAVLPDRHISLHRNLVTQSGRASIESNLNGFKAAYRAALAKDDTLATAAARREVRYWTARLANAEVIKSQSSPTRAAFATTVTVRRHDGREQTFRIVGEDEADPRHGALFYLSPLAQAVVGHERGETLEFLGEKITIVKVLGS